MMNNKDLERTIKDKMSNLNKPVDTDSLWDTLSEHVPEPKSRKRKGFLYFQLAGLLFLASLVVFYFSSTNLQSEKSILLSNNINKNTIANKNLSIQETSSILSNNTKQTNNISLETTQNTIALVDNLTNKTIKLSNVNTIKSTSKKISNFQSEKSQLENLSIDIPLTIGKVTGSNNAIETIKKQNDIQQLNIPLHNVLALETIKLKPIKKPKTVFNISPELLCSNVAKRTNFSWVIGFKLGYFDQNNKSLYPESNGFATALNKYSSSKPLYGIQVGLKYDFYKNWFFNTGISYSSFATKLHPKWVNTDESISSISGSKITSENDYESIGHQYFHIIDIPLNIGYQFFQKNKIGLSLELGPVVNINTITKGVVLNEENKIKNLVSTPFKNHFNLGWRYGVTIDYRINKKLKIYLKPNYTERSIQYNYNNNNLSQKHKNYDLNMGLYYNFVK